MDDGRICNSCGKHKPWDQFAYSSSGRNGRRATCKTCVNLAQARPTIPAGRISLPARVRRSLGI